MVHHSIFAIISGDMKSLGYIASFAGDGAIKQSQSTFENNMKCSFHKKKLYNYLHEKYPIKRSSRAIYTLFRTISVIILSSSIILLLIGNNIASAEHVSDPNNACYPEWTSSVVYAKGSYVSYGTTTYECCIDNSSNGDDYPKGCNKGEPNCTCSKKKTATCGGGGIAKEVTTITYNNWKCTGSPEVWCNNENYKPGNIFGATDWTMESTTCDVSFFLAFNISPISRHKLILTSPPHGYLIFSQVKLCMLLIILPPGVPHWGINVPLNLNLK